VGLDKPLTADQLKAIQKGTQAIYAFGEIAYDDAFGECRVTRYRFFYSGVGADNGSCQFPLMSRLRGKARRISPNE
jgi:hypothetical protein